MTHIWRNYIRRKKKVVEQQPPMVEQDQRRLNMIQHQPKRYGYLITNKGVVLLMDQDEPETYQEVITNHESKKWLDAIKFEMDSMYTNQVWNW